MKTRKTWILVLVMVFSLTALFTGCGSSDNTEPAKNGNTTGANQQLSGTVNLVGSTSVQPLAQELADAFSDIEKDVVVDIQAGGSTAGIKAANDGTADIGNASRELAEEEKGWGLTENIIAYDGIAVVVNPKNPVTDLTKDQLVKIFKGEIKNWKEVGGPDKEILVVSREAGSGTRGAFEELLALEKKEGENKISLVRADALIANGTGVVNSNIASKENAIGYTSLGYLNETIKPVKIDGVECTSENVKSKAYAIQRPFLMLTKGDLKPQTKAFMDFIMSDEGQAIVAKKYITVK